MSARKKTDPLSALRGRIDALDDEIVALLNRRAGVAQEIGSLKAKRDQKAYAPERERQVLERITQKSGGPLGAESLRAIYKEIISASLALETRLDIAYFGPEATFTHEAAKRQFGLSARLAPRRTIPEVFDDVERGRATYGVVPIENSTEGIVNHTLDTFMRSELFISAEVLLEVSHHLLTRSGDAHGITKVYSHPQAFAQCRIWLEQNLPSIPLIEVSSTARAAQLAAQEDGAAAVASDLAASLYDLGVAASEIEDLKGNLTRFVVVGHDQPAPTGNDRTSIMFTLRDAPGILFRALEPFADAGINLSRIESRPSRRRAWDYLFFVDLVGHRDDRAVKKGVQGLERACQYIRILGSYPQGKLARVRSGRR